MLCTEELNVNFPILDAKNLIEDKIYCEVIVNIFSLRNSCLHEAQGGRVDHLNDSFLFLKKVILLNYQGVLDIPSRDLTLATGYQCICIIRLTQLKKIPYPASGYMFRHLEVIIRPFIEHKNLRLQWWSANGIPVLQV
jgi:hypothetical protein